MNTEKNAARNKTVKKIINAATMVQNLAGINSQPENIKPVNRLKFFKLCRGRQALSNKKSGLTIKDPCL